jgi:hypothetical protein
MVVAIPLVIGIAAISTNRRIEIAAERAAAAQIAGDILDGRPRSLVVVGSDTSFVWPTMLQDMLDDHAGGERLYHVHNAAAAGAPLQAWIDDDAPDGLSRPFDAMTRDYFGDDARLRAVAPEPSVALCQVSLEGVRTPRGPVGAADDEVGIRMGANALETLAASLHDAGVARVLLATRIHTPGAEPEAGNERLALRELVERALPYVDQGPDVWSLTIARFPDVYDADRVHPNDLGMKLIAEAWYRTLAGDHASQAVIDRMHARDYNTTEIVHDHLQRTLAR